MTKDDITRIAREAGFSPDASRSRMLERFATLVYEATFRDANIAASRTILDAAVLEEREACAKIADMRASTRSEPDLSAEAIAWAIRRRGAV